MAEAHIDHPGDVSWFAGHGPARVLGDCPHGDCPHSLTGTIAWGPDFEHYTLTECRVEDGCAGQCRGWTSEYPPPFSEQRPKYRQRAFKLVEVPARV